jgi:surfactin synthase thioesterase subunit
VIPVVCLLPPLGHPAAIYERLAEALAPQLDVVALDYPLEDLDLHAPDLLGALAERLAPAISARNPAIVGGISLGASLWYLLAERVGAQAIVLMAPGAPRTPATRREAILAAMAELGEVEFCRRHFGQAQSYAEALCALLRAALEADFAAAMTRLPGRIEVVWGEEDRLFTARHMDRVRRALPPHRYHILAGVGHYAAAEAPDKVADIIRSVEIP